LDCRYCEIQIEITKRAYAARCPNPVAVLDYIKEKMKASVRPWVDIADMKRSTFIPATPSLTIEDEPTMSESKKSHEADDDLLVTAAKAIGSTLGKFAVKSGIAKPTEPAAKARKKAPKKTLAKKTVKKAVKKAVSKAAKKAAPAAKPKRGK
jgi:hypothetical protein